MVVKLVNDLGPKKWSVIASHLPGRIGKQCRERWHNHLNPDIRKDAWSPEEDEKLIELHAKIGNRWAEIAKVLKGRYGRGNPALPSDSASHFNFFETAQDRQCHQKPLE